MNLTLREILDRYGPALAVVAVLALLGILVPATDRGTGVQTVAGGPAGSTPTTLALGGGGPSGPVGGGATGTPTAGGTTGGTAGATPGGTPGGGGAAPGPGGGFTGGANTPPPQAVDGPVWRPEHGPGNYPAPTPDTQCREDGAMPEFSFYSPQCVPVFDGDNGGATSQGVTADSVLVVRYAPQVDPATQATLRAIGADDDPEVHEAVAQALARYYNLHLETYKREVKVVRFDGSGPGDDPETLRADAVTIATELKPFAVYHDTVALDSVFGEELAARGIICICTTSASAGYYRDTAPYTYTILPTTEEYYLHIAEYIGKRLWGKPAKWAGTSLQVTNEVRRFGLIYLEGSPGRIDPRAKQAVDFFKAELARYGARLEKDVAYVFDIQQQQQQSTNIIAQMVAAGVNNVICVCDPLYPIFLTGEATRQQYFPEWFITGTGLIDTTFFGRTYDQAQWAHAFGISPLWVFFEDVSESSGYRTFHHVVDAPRGAEGTGINVYQAPIQTIFNGIHYAGPTLTVQNWAAGLFQAAPVGGIPTAPLVKFTQEFPSAIKDFTEVWWDQQSTGKDETGKDGVGILMKSNGGARYQPGQWPQADPYVFTDDPNPTFRLPGQVQTFDHDADGHNHYNDPRRCRSCPQQ